MEKVNNSALVVEDDQDLREAVQRLLESSDIEGIRFDIDAVEDGRSALERLRTKTYDFMILDYYIPHINGEGVINHLRSDGGPNAQIPIIIISGLIPKLNLDNQARITLLNKPFGFDEIQTAVRLALENRFVRPELATAK